VTGSVHGSVKRTAPVEVVPGTWLIDTLLADQPRMVGVYAQATPDGRVVLIETGSGATVEAVRSGLESLGAKPGEIVGIVVTHIHLDHAAGAGALSAWSGAPVYVHPLGRKHLADPSRLWRSAARIYGDAMDRLWGPMEPVPEQLLHPLEDGATIDLGGARYQVLHTPGHARHHLSLLDADGNVFVGDAAGILLPDVALIRPALPPPETDLEAAAESCRRIAELQPERLLLTHFGAVQQVHDHLQQVVERNTAWGAEVKAGMDAGEDEATLIRRIERLEDRELAPLLLPDAALVPYRASSDARMTVMGLSRYWRLRDDAAEAPADPSGDGSGES